MNQTLIEQATEYGFYAKLSNEEKLIKYIQFENTHTNIDKLLNKEGININYQNELGFTPLMYACVNNNMDALEILLNHGARLDIKTNTGLTALDIAKFNGSRKAYDYLLKKTKNTTKNFWMGSSEFDYNKKHTPFEILKNVVYCENPVTGKKLMHNIENEILLYGDYRIQLIIAFIATYILNNQQKDNFEIFISDSENIISITGNDYYKDSCGGLNLLNNIIQISSKGEFAHTSRTLLHELTHKVHTMLENTDKNMLQSCLKKFKAIVYLMKENAAKYWLKKFVVERINKDVYNDDNLKLEEIVADMSNATIYANGLGSVLINKIEANMKNSLKKNIKTNLHKEILNNIDDIKAEIVADIENTKKNILFAIKPIQEYFDIVMMPQMTDYILNSPYFKNLYLSDTLKVQLRKSKTKTRTVEKNHFIKNTPEKIIDRVNMCL